MSSRAASTASASTSGIPTEEHAELRGHEGPVLAVRFNRDGRYLLTCGKDRTFRLWNPYKATLIKTYGGHAHEVRDVAAAAADNSRRVPEPREVSASRDESVPASRTESRGRSRAHPRFGHLTSPSPTSLSQGRGVRRRQAGVLVGRHHGSEDPSLPRPRVGGQRRPLRRRRFAVRERRLRSRRARLRRSIQRQRPDPDHLRVPRRRHVTRRVRHPHRRRKRRRHRSNLRRSRRRYIAGCTASGIAVSAGDIRDGACVLAGLLGSRVALLDAEDGDVLAECRGGHVAETTRVDARLTNDDARVAAASEDGKVYFTSWSTRAWTPSSTRIRRGRRAG